MYKINTTKPYSIFAEDVEKTALKQFENVMNEPCVIRGVLMPDTHTGYTMPIGCVVATQEHIVPQFVGFDIGCGVATFKTEFKKTDFTKTDLQLIYDKITKTIPLGSSKHDTKQTVDIQLPLTQIGEKFLNETGLYQLGTLGGGNHFIEIGYDDEDYIYITVHSGSRGFGAKIAQHYMTVSFHSSKTIDMELETLIDKWKTKQKNFKKHNPVKYNEVLKTKLIQLKEKLIDKYNKFDISKLDGIYPLNTASTNGRNYITDMNFALSFALENRKKMIKDVLSIMNEISHKDCKFVDIEPTFINRNHNHAELNSNGEFIHRKGATHAEKEMLGVIPANMKDGVFIVKGLGNDEYLCSSSHGAGRVLSRRKAKRNLSISEFKDNMKDIIGTVCEDTLDEAPKAYKNIYEVMVLQKDSVQVIKHIKPLINVKGTD